jgi:chromosome segregation ATPase
LADGLALVPLPPSLLDYSDLVPDGILLALKTFIPTPVPRVLRRRPQKPQLDKDEERAGEPTLLLLRKELVESQTLLEDRHRDVDTVKQAMQMLSNETTLWVKRCEEMAEVLQEVEMERDNYKAGEGVAKALGKGVTVKLEEMNVGGGTTARLDLAAELTDTENELLDTKTELADSKTELADTKTELADTKDELADTRTELADIKAQLFNSSQDLNGLEAALSQSAIQLATDADELKRKTARYQAVNTELQRQLQYVRSELTEMEVGQDQLYKRCKSEREIAVMINDLRRQSESELDEMKAERLKAAEAKKLAVDEVRKGFQKQLDETEIREAELMAKNSGLERDLRDLQGWTEKFRSVVMKMPNRTKADADGNTTDPATLDQSSTRSQAQ